MQKMSEERAIVILKGAIKKPNTEDGYMGQAITLAIEALEKQSMVNEILHECTELKKELDAYKAGGTVDQCREAVEKMKPKKVKKIQIPNTSWSKACTRFECPSCNKYLNYMELSHCGLCGQCLDWSE